MFRAALVAVSLFLGALFWTRYVRAEALPVIAAGREAEIVALARPYAGDDVAVVPGWKLGNIAVEPHTIKFHLLGPGGRKATLRLEHPSTTPSPSESTASFALRREGDPGADAQAALTALASAVRANDKGSFWPAKPPEPGLPDGAVAAPKHHASSRFADGELHRLLRVLDATPRIFRDGVVLFVAALVFALLHLRRVLRDEPRWIRGGLALVVVVGAVLRVAIAREAPMNAWPYERVVPLARSAFEGAVVPWIARALSARPFLTDVIFATTLLLAIVTPLVFFAHARYVLRDARAALFAAAILVVLPIHIRFSRADSELVQSLATSSLTFVVLYTALRDGSRAWRAVCFVLLPIFSVATYFVRPENMFFYLVDVGAIALTSGEEAPRRRKVVAAIEVTAAAAFAFVVHLLAQYKGAIQAGLSPRTLWNAVGIFFDLRLNTLINPSITPPGLTLLAIVGFVTLWRLGHRHRALFLGAWLLGFFVVHSFVVPTEPAMQARYHLHLVTPLLLLAASALPWIERLPRRAAVATGVYLAASPLFHLRFERDVDFNEMHEFAFLRAARATIPEGCTVLELSPAVGAARPEHIHAPRLGRIATRLDGGHAKQAFRVVNTGVLAGARHGDEPYESLSPEALAILAKPPPCLMVYEGLTCKSHRPGALAEAPVCKALHEKLDLRPVSSISFPSRIYDEASAGRVVEDPVKGSRCRPVLTPGETLTLTLYQASTGPTIAGDP